MDNKIIIFSGAPASGKDTVTSLICESDKSLVALIKHRGSEEIQNNNTYHNISLNEFEQMISNDAFVQYHQRYGRYYGIAKSELEKSFKSNFTPIIHAGKIMNIKTIESNSEARAIKILLWAKRDSLEQRLIGRHPNDSEEVKTRLSALDEEYKEWIVNLDFLSTFDLIIENNVLKDTANLILDYVNGKLHQPNYSLSSSLNDFQNYLNSEYKS